MEPFQLLIKPASGECNLACDYCFYRGVTPELYPGQKKRRMSPDLAQRFVADLMSHRFAETVFSWQGGEPTLMGLEFFSQVVEFQQRYGVPGQVVGNALQTNGLLLDRDWARFLARYKFLVGLSLDGPRKIHDHFRRSAGGSGSFDRVMAAADLMASEGVAFNILCVVNRANQDQGAEVYRFFQDQGFDHVHFIPCLETDPRTGRVTDFSATPDGLKRFFVEVFDHYRRDGFQGTRERNFDALLSLHLTGRAGMCAYDGACGQYLVVEYNGDIYPCDFFVQEEWRLGNVTERPLARFFEHPLMKEFQAARGMVPAECLECDFGQWCRGGCLKDRLPHLASLAGRSVFCRAIKRCFQMPEIHRKTYARSMEQAGGATGPPRNIGRNDPCYCGSGLKYKKCCLKKGY